MVAVDANGADLAPAARAGPPVVAVDANGADLGPAEVAAGAALAAQRGARVLLFGPASEMAGLPAGVEVVDAPVSIAKSPDPARAARAHPESSIVRAARAVAEGRAQALVCAGGTGAALAAGLFNIKRARGIHRPALALPLPVPGHPVTLLDVGANAQARAEHLVQFAFMGAALARTLLDVSCPRVGLLSNGEELGRGSALVLEARAELAERLAAAADARGAVGPPGAGANGSGSGGHIGEAPLGEGDGQGSVALAGGGPFFELVGNVEGRDLTSGAADVIVTDGFTGNIALKVMEGVSQTMLRAIRDAATSSPRAQLGGLLLRPALRAFRDEIDPEGQGGAYLLGLRRLGVVPHGSFTRHGFAQAILRAARGAEEDLVGRTHAALEHAGALRGRVGGPAIRVDR
ncbi:MAG TPA: phosphate acyltransferase PlsX [Solirubrobacteraceae bacterium]|nr:phosphate acyltransferase PlsX [Solirubrobacteraceae bacterium]